jgi:hypothetical protein
MLCNLSKHNTTYTIQIQTLRQIPQNIEKIADTVNDPGKGVAKIADTVTDANSGLPKIAGTLTDANSGLPKIAGTLTDANSGLPKIVGTLTDANSGLPKIVGTLTDANSGLGAIAGTVNDPKIGVAQIARQVGLAGDLDPPGSVPTLIKDALQAQFAAKFVDDLVPLAMHWLHEHEHWDAVQHEFPGFERPSSSPPKNSLVQLYGSAAMFANLWDAARYPDHEQQRLAAIKEYWDTTTEVYDSDNAMVGSIPKSEYLADAIRRLYVLFIAIERHQGQPTGLGGNVQARSRRNRQA